MAAQAGSKTMIALNTAEERQAHRGIAVGYTEDWIRERIAYVLMSWGGDENDYIKNHGIDTAFEIVLESWEDDGTQGMNMQDLINWACDEVWEPRANQSH